MLSLLARPHLPTSPRFAGDWPTRCAGLGVGCSETGPNHRASRAQEDPQNRFASTRGEHYMPVHDPHRHYR